MQYSAAQGYFSPEIAQFFRLFAAHPFRTPPQPSARSGRGRIAQTKELRAVRARFCHVGSIVSNAPAAVRRAQGADISSNASPLNHRTASRPRAILPCRLIRFERARSRRRARGAGTSSNASPKINEQRAGRARFCHVGSIVSNAPAVVRRARGAGISSNASPPNRRTASSPRAILPCRLIWAQRLSCAALPRSPRPALRSARPAPRRMRSRPGAD